MWTAVEGRRGRIGTLLQLLSWTVLASALLIGSRAHAQACCAGSGAYQPARLKLHEEGLLGIQVTADDALGNLDSTGGYISNPPGTGELDLQESLVGTIRVVDRLQLGATIPFVETYRVSSPITDFGGGLGDVSISARYDFLFAAESAHVPGLALTGGITAPTGTPPEQAHDPLLADATGTGAWQGALGGSVEQLLAANFIVSLNGQFGLSSARTVGTIHEQLGPTILGLLAFGYSYQDSAVALALSTTQSLKASQNGVVVPGTNRGWTTLSLTGGTPLGESWRIQASVNYDLPGLGSNHIAGIGGTFTLLRIWA